MSPLTFNRIVEVSARDGLQNLPPPAVPTSLKQELVQRLLETGIKDLEVGSFVRGDRIPQVSFDNKVCGLTQQMADTASLLPLLPSSASGTGQVR